MELPVVCSKP